MLQTLGTTAGFLCVLLLILLLLLLLLLVEEGRRGGARWEARPRRGVIVGVKEDVGADVGRGVGAWAEAKTGA